MILTRRIGISIDNGPTLNRAKTRRTLIVPNQAIATYVTQWTYDSHNRLIEMIYPDEEKVTYSYNLGGLLEKVRGEKSYGYDYITKLGYDKFEQRSYLKYCNGAETFYTYDDRRRLSNLAVNSGGTSIMDNAYTFDAVSNVLSVANNASLPANGNAGGQMSHTYTYDGLYRLATATGTYTGADNKSASYTLAMGYDNMHRIKSKSQHLTQDNVQFNGTLNNGYDLTYTYSSEEGKKFQLESVKDVNYRTEETPEGQQIENGHSYTYDKNGNLVYVNTNRVMTDGHRDNSVGERKLIWDEENRLLAVDDNGFVSNYWYDADGERTVKTSGESDQVYVNGVFSGGSTNTAKFSLYVSPYLVANQGGRYTKHIYAGSQRIVSKVGDFASYGSDPRRIEYAGANTDGLSVDYKSKYAAQQQVIKDNYKFFDVPYNGTDNDNYADGEGFCCNDGSMEAAVAQARKAQTRAVSRSFKDPDNYENLQFFYHPDHLGSSSFITNLEGEVVQHIEYVPFGEVFIEERNNVWNTPYLFNAKEFDEETGMYYYGARYYDPRLSLWMSADPMQEKHNNISTYCYAYNNPVNFVDPTGMDWVSSTSDDGVKTWAWNDNVSSLEEAQKLGYSDYRAKGSILDNAKIGKGDYGSVYLGYSSDDISYTTSNKEVTPWQVGVEWLSGEGPRDRQFQDGDYFAEMLRTHSHYQDAIQGAIEQIRNGKLEGEDSYELGGLGGVAKYIKDYSTLLTAGKTGNIAVTYLGSYNLQWRADVEGNTAVIHVTITNSSTMQSASRPPVVGYWSVWQNSVGKWINKTFSTGWGSKTTQTFNLTETVKL